jgi:hypothetical protein
LLWQATVSKAGDGRIVQAWASRGEPGYEIRVHGYRDARIVNIEGVPFLSVQDAGWRQAVERFKLDQPGGDAHGDT